MLYHTTVNFLEEVQNCSASRAVTALLEDRNLVLSIVILQVITVQNSSSCLSDAISGLLQQPNIFMYTYTNSIYY